ncbi:MAG: ATP-binding cassette domain-containing protein [Culicoidibacterales bacterium]
MITLKNVTKTYGDEPILKGVNYQFPETGVVCLIGPSGSGKTTLLQLLAGFDTAYQGEIIIFGENLATLSARQRCQYRQQHIGFVFQDYCLLPGYTALENVMIACEQHDCDALGKARQLLQRLGIAAQSDQLVEVLSGGQKQRVALARALMHDPEIIFADEPTGALDHQAARELLTLLREIAQERLVVMITHDQNSCTPTDEIITIQAGDICVQQQASGERVCTRTMSQKPVRKLPVWQLARKNWRIHWQRYCLLAVMMTMSVVASLFATSVQTVLQQKIGEFEQKNPAFTNGFIQTGANEHLLASLKQDQKIEQVYYQYVVEDVTLKVGDQVEVFSEKFPTPKTTERLSYGVMPRNGAAEIALTPNLARKFSATIETLIGQTVSLTYAGQTYSLTISGIYNASSNDFIVSSDVEQQWYKAVNNQPVYALSYDVKSFTDVVPVSEALANQGLVVETAANEVAMLQQTFDNLRVVFLTVASVIIGVGVSLAGIVSVKLQQARSSEFDLLAALGFTTANLKTMALLEFSGVVSLAGVGVCGLAGMITIVQPFSLTFTLSQIGVAIVSLIAISLSFRIGFNALAFNTKK